MIYLTCVCATLGKSLSANKIQGHGLWLDINDTGLALTKKAWRETSKENQRSSGQAGANCRTCSF